MARIETPEINAIVRELVTGTGRPLFTGATRYNETSGRPRNSSCLLGAEGQVTGYYDKVHLAPFGEYVPLGRYLPFVQKIVPAISDIEPGTDQRTFAVAGRRFGPLICFEVLFPGLAENLRQQGADFLVVITNLGWFGASNAIPQELEIARIRAIETRLPLVHCANTGISGVFDPWGRFAMVRGAFDGFGDYRTIDSAVTPDRTIGVRLADALPVAAPGKRPIPYGPQAFPWVALGGSLLLAAWAVFVPPPQREPIFKIKPRNR